MTFKYTGDLTGGSLMVRESRIISELLLKNADQALWKDAIEHQNVLQKPTLASAKRNANTVRKRLEPLDTALLQLVHDGDLELATQTCFYAALEKNALLLEFIETEVADAYSTGRNQLPSYLWNEFLDDRSHRDASIKSWSESSCKKMGQVAFRILKEVGMLKDTRQFEVQNMILRPELEYELAQRNKDRFLACMKLYRVCV
tara:strand:- start:15 stop:620 length:606 start_codon:yes stop_codon:yes gene_type:complete